MSMKVPAASLLATALALSWTAPGLADPARPLLLAQASQSAEDIFWQSVQNSSDPAMFQAYLDEVAAGTFKGVYKRLAEIRLKTLGKAPTPTDTVPKSTSAPSPDPTPVAVSPMSAASPASSPEIEACDRAAADTRDDQRPPNIPGIGFEQAGSAGALDACLKATKLPDAPAREFFQLGRAYHATENYKDALLAYNTAIEKGHHRSLIYLADIMLANHRGMKKDAAAALAALEQAADAKVPDSLAMLSYYYLKAAGPRKNYAKAFDYANQAIAAGDIAAYSYLASLYADGKGTRRDKKKACEFWQQGATLGDSQSARFSKNNCRYR